MGMAPIIGDGNKVTVQSCNMENHRLFLASSMLRASLMSNEANIPEVMAAVLREYPRSSLDVWRKQISDSLSSKSTVDLLSLWFDVRDSYLWRMIENEWGNRFSNVDMPSWYCIQECGGYEKYVEKHLSVPQK